MSATRRLVYRDRDRAAAAAVALLQIMATAPEQQRRQYLESYLRDEFAELAHTTANERDDGLDD
jgi:hypothetical protein